MSTHPNIILVTCHDLGRHLGCYGIDAMRTPHIDALAGQGVRFTNAFCTAPQCSPSRAAIATGRYPHNNGVMGLCHAQFGWDMNDDELLLPQLLQQHGYTTALSGTYHESKSPRRAGFKQILAERSRTTGRSLEAETVADGAVQYIRERAGGVEPFYLQVGFFEPHRNRSETNFPGTSDPVDETYIPPFIVDDPGARAEFAAYQGAIRDVDGAMRRILAALDETKQADDTLVIFTTDHGMPFPRAKCSLYDPGLEVCLIMRWSNDGFVNGSTPGAMISNIDYLPTIAELVGMKVPSSVQGRSFAPLLRGRPHDERDAIFGEMTYHDYCDPCRCVRTKSHKLIVNFTNAPSFMDPSQDWRPRTVTVVPDNPAYTYHPPVEMYDLVHDPLETRNLADDPAHEPMRRTLLKQLHQWMRDTKDPLLNGIPSSPMHRRALKSLQTGDLIEP